MSGTSRNRRLVVLVVAMIVFVTIPLVVVSADAFTDVPNSNIFHEDIAWLAEAGITRGCNPPHNTQFCPTENVTREQMAAFMRRLAESEVVDAATAQAARFADYADGAGYSEYAGGAHIATYLNGFHSSDLAPIAAFESSDDLPDEDGGISVTLAAPGPGVVLIDAAVSISGGDSVVTCSLDLDGAAVPGTRMSVQVGSGIVVNTCNTTGGESVDAGSHTVVFNITGVTDAALSDASLNATWIPAGEPSVPVP